jgi:hypothetical protein
VGGEPARPIDPNSGGDNEQDHDYQDHQDYQDDVGDGCGNVIQCGTCAAPRSRRPAASAEEGA